MSEDHFQRLTRLLELESQAAARQALERAGRVSPQEAERAGSCLLDLAIDEESSGLGGRVLVKLVKRSRQPLPWTRLAIGTPVLLSSGKTPSTDALRGIVAGRDETSLLVALDELPDDADGALWRLDYSHDEIAERRQRAALQRARTARGERLAELRAVFLGEKQPRLADRKPLVPFAAGLNPPQRAAIELALAASDLAMIHGPPGTGKTTTLVELIRQAIARGDKVLACAPSNMAVDNLMERLVVAGVDVVRLGHPARVMPQLRERSLDLLVEQHTDVRLAHKLIRDALQLQRKAARYTRARPLPGAKRELRQAAAERFADARRLEQAAVRQILDSADVLCATTTGLDDSVLGPRTFDLAVIDEACQSTEPGCWVPLLRCQRVVLAGDHCQLPPTVVSTQAANEGFQISLFERLMALHGGLVSHRLQHQYRMHASIMEFSSREFYDGSLLADDSVNGHRLCDLPDVACCPITETPIEFIDTAGAGYDEQLEPDGESRFNPQEADLVVLQVRALLEAGVAAEGIAVIAPYAAQVRQLRAQLRDVVGLEIDSVDGFQGREKEAVVISLVRSNAIGEIGFLAEVRRTNVALTRARRKLLVIGDSATLAHHPFYRRLLEYFEAVGGYRTVWEF